jgi:hypothetical protein
MFELAIKLDPNYVHALDNLKNINNSGEWRLLLVQFLLY